MNKKGKITFIAVFFLLVLTISLLMFVKADEPEDPWVLYKRTATQNVYINTETREYRTTIGQGIINFDLEDKNYPNYVPRSEFFRNTTNGYQDNTGFIYNLSNNQKFVNVYDRYGDYMSSFGFAITGTVNGQDYKVSSLDYSWTWSKSINSTEAYFEGDNNANFHWVQKYHFYPNSPMKIENYVENNVADITNGKFWYIQTVNQSENITWNGNTYSLDTQRHLEGEYDNILPNVIFPDYYVFNYHDLIDHGFNITDIYVGDGSLVGADGIWILAVGVTKNNGNFPQGANVTLDPTITLQTADTENLKDAYVSNGGGVGPDDNAGTSTSLYAGQYNFFPNNVWRSYLSFNISSIGASTITSANFSGYIYTGWGTSTQRIFHVYDWINSTGSNILNETQITYNNQPCGTSFDNSTHCNLTNEDSFHVTSTGWWNASIKTMLQSEIDSGSNNLSFALRGTEAEEWVGYYSKENADTSLRPKLIITYTPHIDIISPTPSQILTDDTPKPNFNITNATAFDVCYWTNDSGVTNYSMTNSGDYWYNDTENILLDGSHTVEFSCNQSSDGTWRTSDSVSFDIDSVNVTTCRDLTVSRNYTLLNNITTTGNCFSLTNNSITFDFQGYDIEGDGGATDYAFSLTSYNSSKIKDGNITNFGYDVSLSNSINNILVNMSYNNSRENIGATSNLSRKWYFETIVNDSNGNLQNAQVDFYDKDGQIPALTESTNSTGQITRKELIEYINDGGSTTYKNNYTINITKATYTTNSTSFNLTIEENINHIVLLVLSNTAPSSTLSTPIDNYWADSLTNTMTCNQTDAEGNLKNVTIYTWIGGAEETKNTKSVLGSTNSTEWTNLGFTSQGAYEWNCYVCDDSDACAWAGSNLTLNIDAVNPTVSISTPTNTTNSTDTGLHVNFTATDTNLDDCWYSNNSGVSNTTLASCVNITSTTWADGVWNLTIWANDSASSEGSDNIRFTIDTTAPILTILTPTNTTNSTDTGLHVNYTATDTNLHSCWYSNNSGVSNVSLGCSNITSTTWTDGVWNLTIWANDTTGTENSTTIRFTIDSTNPLIDFDTATENNNTNFSRDWIYSNVTFTEINFRNITFNLYNSTHGLNTSNYYSTETRSNNWTSLNDGIYYYNVTIYDYSSNSNSTETRKITIDDTAPTINIVAPSNLSSYNDGTNFQINFTSSDNLIGQDDCWYTNNSGTTNNSVVCTNNITITLSDATYTYIIYSNDTLGNIGRNSIQFTISSVAPAINLNYPANDLWISNGTDLYINFTATDTDGIDDCQLWGNWAGWHLNYTWESTASGSMNWTQVNLSDGNYIYNVWCNDTLDNNGFSANNFTFHIDTTFPLIAYESATEVDNTNFSRDWIYVNVTWIETNFNNVTFHLSNDTGAVNTTTYTGAIYLINWTDLLDGNYTYWINISDDANNQNSTSVRTITIDDTNPNATLIFPGNATYNSTLSQNFTSNLTDNLGIQNATLYVYNETGEYNKTSETFSPNLLEKSFGVVIILIDGIYNWWVDLFDWSGNTYQTDNYTVTIDSIAPAVTNQSYSPTTVYNTLNISIFGNITDTNLDTVWLQINHSGSYTNITITDNLGDQYNYTLLSNLISNRENISWYWWANDSAGNSNVSRVDFFIATNRNPSAVTISNPSNETYINSNGFYVNFSSTDADSDTLNYSIFYSNNNTDYVIANWTNTFTYYNLSGFNTTDKAINYFRVNVSDDYLNNVSEIYTFYIDTTNPSVNLSYPEASPVYQCSMINIWLNYSASDANLDYCEFNVTFAGSVSTVNTRMSTCANTTFNVSYDDSVQTLTLIAVDYAGNIEKTTRSIYIDTDNSGCPSPSVTPPAGGGGTPPVETTVDLGYCGDDICQDGKGNRTDRGETFFNCAEDCAITLDFGDINLDTIIINCFDGDSETPCAWETSPGLLFIFVFVGGMILFTIFFQFKPKAKGIKKFVYSPSFKSRRRRRR